MTHPMMQNTPSGRSRSARTGAEVLGPSMRTNCTPPNYAGQTPGPGCREYYLGIDSEAQAAGGIAAGATVTVVTEPQEPFVAYQFLVASTVSPFFLINQIQVGRIPQAVADGPVLAEVFSSASFRAGFLLDPANRGTEIRVQVTNIDGNARRFSGCFIGYSQGCS